MDTKKRITKKHISAFVALCIIPLLLIILGIGLLISDTLPNSAFVCKYIILPICTVLLFAVVIFSGRIHSAKITLSVLISIAFAIAYLALSFFGKFIILSHYENEELSTGFVDIVNVNKTMPSFSEIANPEKMKYYDYFSSQFGIFTCDVNALVCQYDKDTFLSQKKFLDEKYNFEQQTITDIYGYTCETTATINDYFFRILSAKDSNYPKNVFLIATNDITNEVVYMSFSDDDLDYIVSLTEFINEDCGWKYIK